MSETEYPTKGEQRFAGALGAVAEVLTGPRVRQYVAIAAWLFERAKKILCCPPSIREDLMRVGARAMDEYAPDP